MAALTDFAENLILNWLMTAGAATRPTQWWVALYTTATTDAGGGTEVTGAGYSRKSVTFNTASGTGGNTTNSNVPSFTASGGSFGTVTHIAIRDASTAGNALWHGAMTTSKTIADGETLEFAAGDISLTIA